MMDEGYLLERIKDQLCFVSADVAADLRLARGRNSPFRRVRRRAAHAPEVPKRCGCVACSGAAQSIRPLHPACNVAQERVCAARRADRHLGPCADGGRARSAGGCRGSTARRAGPCPAQAAGAHREQRAVHGARGPLPPARCAVRPPVGDPPSSAHSHIHAAARAGGHSRGCRYWNGRGGAGRGSCSGGAGCASASPCAALLKHPVDRRAAAVAGSSRSAGIAGKVAGPACGLPAAARSSCLPTLQVARRGAQGCATGCMQSCGRWCQTTTRWAACRQSAAASRAQLHGWRLPIPTPVLPPAAAGHLLGRRPGVVCLEGRCFAGSLGAVPPAGSDASGVATARCSCLCKVGRVTHWLVCMFCW